MPRKAESPARPVRDPDSGAAALLLALGHPLRLKLLRTIEEEGCCQCEMAGLLKAHPVNISRHLAVLIRAGLVELEKRGVKTYPRLVRPGVLALLDEAREMTKPPKRSPAKH